MKSDKEILAERAKSYGPASPMFKAIGTIQWENFKFLSQKLGGREPTPVELGQVAALNMSVVKMVRSIQNPKDPDHAIDGRNYWTISENLGE